MLKRFVELGLVHGRIRPTIVITFYYLEVDPERWDGVSENTLVCGKVYLVDFKAVARLTRRLPSGSWGRVIDLNAPTREFQK